MSKTFFTSDLHFRHRSILIYTDREDVLKNKITLSLDEAMQRHDEWLVETINKHVGARDQLYILGDVVIGANPWLAGYWISQINCVHKHLITGNHDDKLVEFYQKTPDLFETVVKHRDEIKLNGKRIILDHHPIAEWNGGHHGAWHLHGHCHGNFDYKSANLHDKRILDVGWDNAYKVLGEFRPFEFADIEKYMEGRVSIQHHGKAD